MGFLVWHKYTFISSTEGPNVGERPTKENGHAIMCMQFPIPCFSHSGDKMNIMSTLMTAECISWVDIQCMFTVLHHLHDQRVKTEWVWQHRMPFSLFGLPHSCFTAPSDDEIMCTYVRSQSAFSGHKYMLNKPKKDKWVNIATKMALEEWMSLGH